MSPVTSESSDGFLFSVFEVFPRKNLRRGGPREKESPVESGMVLPPTIGKQSQSLSSISSDCVRLKSEMARSVTVERGLSY
jgi:hypothetical protein